MEVGSDREVKRRGRMRPRALGYLGEAGEEEEEGSASLDWGG